MRSQIYQRFCELQKQEHKQIALLIDPDKSENCASLVRQADKAGVDIFLVGGSLIFHGNISETIRTIKQNTQKPVIIFPGSNLHICKEADAILLLSLVSGRNPEYLIGQHVVAAHALAQSGLEIISTGYLLIDGGIPTTVSYISNTTPIPQHKPEIAAATALASQLLGMQMIYLDCGSGAQTPIDQRMIQLVRQTIRLPLLVGGGLRSAENILSAWHAGADICVVGTAIEQNPSALEEMMQTLNQFRNIALVHS
ncbi:MAG: geranylgeranylglyceryl/heptaprenylglyceryl phosphate synthase [Cytophagales bacterium]|nr:geranylgeranylglyceryl/heptaprenylglyceryl phosphate synthase [Cytophagales bacterium]MDW8383172.1 geranylgeranylglyceryl/heptaprenylglyceryl phosphate synthase [Flammeovirgaceae bacterium]